MPLQEFTRQALQTVVDKAQRLNRSHFVEYLRKERKFSAGVSWRAAGDLIISREGPDDDAIQALALTLRFFLQNREPISFHNLSETVAQDPELSEEWKREVKRTRDDLNSFLDDTPSPVALIYNEHKLTRREILLSRLYGDLAHSNAEDRTVFEAITNDPFLRPLYQQEFDVIFVNILNAVNRIANLCIDELKADDIKRENAST
jgi:hypothetical protein